MEVRDIEIDKINIIENIRQKELKEDLAELMQSIKYTGLMQPIGVKITKKGYDLIWGFRRLTAFKNLGYNKIPAVMFVNENEAMTEEDFLIANASENIHHKQVSYIELGRICKQLTETMSKDEIAVKLGLPKGRIESALQGLRKIPKKYRDKIVFFDNMSAKAGRKGKVPFNLAYSVANTRGLTQVDAEKIMDWAVLNNKNVGDIMGVKQLLKDGYSVKDALEFTNNYQSVSFKLLLKKDFYETQSSKKGGYVRAIKELIKSKWGNVVL